MISRQISLVLSCFLLFALQLNGQELDWLIDPEEFLPPGDITIQYSDPGCTSEFENCMWTGILDGEVEEESWPWQVMPDVHFSYHPDRLYEISYNYLPCDAAIELVEDLDFSSGGALVPAIANAALESEVCVLIEDGNGVDQLEYCFSVTIQCGSCGETGNIYCSTCEQSDPPLADGGCRLCDPIELAEGYKSCTPPCDDPSCPPLGAPQPGLLCDVPGFVAHNMSWFAFVASSYEATVEVFIYNCIGAGVQSGIYPSCDFNEPCVGFNVNCTTNATIEYDAIFNIGQTYYMFVDGCNGSECEYEVTVNGLNELVPDDIDHLTAYSICSDQFLTDEFITGAGNASITGDCEAADRIAVCPDDWIQLGVRHQGNIGNFQENDRPCDEYAVIDANFQWSTSWGPSYEFNPHEEDTGHFGPEIQVPSTAGIYNVCLDFIDYECYPVIGPVCLELEVREGMVLEYYVDNDGDGYGTGDPIMFNCPAPEGYSCKPGDCDDNNPNSISQAQIPPTNFSCSVVGEAVLYTWDVAPSFSYNLSVPTNVMTSSPAPNQLLVEGFTNDCQYVVVALSVSTNSGSCVGIEESLACRLSPMPEISFELSNSNEIFECQDFDFIVVDAIVDGVINPDEGSWSENVNGSSEGFIFLAGDLIFDPTDLAPGIYTARYTFENPLTGCLELAVVSIKVKACGIDNDGDGSPQEEDCDDNDSSIFPGGTEICDGKDNNCDGQIDEGVGLDSPMVVCAEVGEDYITFDWSAVPPATGYVVCIDGVTYPTVTATETSFTETGLAPGMEVFFAVQATSTNGCVSEKVGIVCTTVDSLDSDGDGVPAPEDCDDNDPTVFPDNTEICDGKDNNCNGQIDEGFNFPSPTVVCASSGSDFVVIEWNPVLNADYYVISYTTHGSTQKDTVDSNFYSVFDITTGVVDFCVQAAFSNGCLTEKARLTCTTGNNTTVDLDGDGSIAALDCDDNDPNNYPGNTEICDGQDNNCDGQIDEGFSVEALVLSCIAVTSNSVTIGWELIDADVYYVYRGNEYLGSSNTGSYTIDGLSATESVEIRVDAVFTTGCPLQSEVITCVTGTDTDADGDGSPAGVDCDDNDPNNFPGNTEICDGQDNNCDGQIDEGVLLDAAVISCMDSGIDFVEFAWEPVPGAVSYDLVLTDPLNGTVDIDGYVGTNYIVAGLAPEDLVTLCVAAVAANSCSVTSCFDCTATSCELFPTVAFNPCEEAVGMVTFSWNPIIGIDSFLINMTTYSSDTSFTVDNLAANESVTITVQAVHPTSGCVISPEQLTCTAPFAGVDNDGDGVPAGEDCDDNDPNNYPGNEEICDGQDNNCNGEIDEGLDFQTYYSDNDMDGYGVDGTGFEDCLQPPDTTTEPGDCDDTNPDINPDATEIPNNGIDEDCDGEDETSATHNLGGYAIDIFPNPVQSILYIKTDLAELDYSLYGIDGRLITAGVVNEGKVLMDEQIESGSYVLKLYSPRLNAYVVETIIKK